MANTALSSRVPGAVTKRGWFSGLREEWSEYRLAYLLLAPSTLAFLIFLVFPIINMIVSAFSQVDTLGRIVKLGGVQNFVELAKDPRMPMIIWQTAVFAFGSVFLTLVIAYPLAMILNTSFPGQTAAKALILVPWAMPFAISAITWRWIFHGQMGSLNYLLSKLGLIQEYIVWLNEPKLALGAIIFVEVWSSVPFMTITFLAAMQAIPPHIYDAAKMDGANIWHEFIDMTLPQTKMVIMIVTMLSIIWAFRGFTVVWVLTRGNPLYRTDIAVTYLFKIAFENLRFGAGFALAVSLFVVLVIFSILYTRLSGTQEEA
ncbi:MAG: sugar ABC transporter permease [Caldilineaceae bacterium]|nr:sugar ABC transporter permease [Caldilineaceae bacterium]